MHAETGSLRYELVDPWGDLPPDVELGDVAGIETDRHGHIVVLHRGHPPILVFDTAGHLLDAWGEGLLVHPHGVSVGPDGEFYLVDDAGNKVLRCDERGAVDLSLSFAYSDTGYDGYDYRTIRQSGQPFNRPTNVAVAPSGDFYVADGYGNCRIHHYTADGRLRESWGTPGSQSGQFVLPHGIHLSSGHLYVADRENDRIQVFGLDGTVEAVWPHIRRPTDICQDPSGRFVVSSMFAIRPDARSHSPVVLPGYVSVYSGDGELLCRWGDTDAAGDGLTYAVHTVATDDDGSVYVGEITATSSRGRAPRCYRPMRKFKRLGA